MTPSLRCSLPGLLVLLPYHVGFHLHDSLVVVALRQGRVDLVERVDIPPEAPLDDLTTARLVLALHRRQPSAVVVVAYSDRIGAMPALGGLVDAVGPVVPVVRVVEVRGSRWRDVPGQVWTSLPTAADVPLVAEYVGRGVHPLPDRDALTAVLSPVPGPAADAMAVEVARRGRPGTRDGLAAWHRLLDLDREPERRDEVTALAFLARVVDRDAVLARLVPTTGGDEEQFFPGVPGSLDPAEEQVCTRAVLIRLAAIAPPPVRAAALSVLAVWAWDAGDGATASIAADLALAHDPTYVLASLVGQLLRCDVRPPAA